MHNSVKPLMESIGVAASAIWQSGAMLNSAYISAVRFHNGRATVTLEFIDGRVSEVTADASNPHELAEAMQTTYETVCKSTNLLLEIRQHGHVFIENMTRAQINYIRAAWSDAYGEDELVLYAHENFDSTLTGFLKTRLTPEELRGRDEEF